MGTETAATILAGLIFFAIVGGILLYKNNKKLKIEIVDKD